MNDITLDPMPPPNPVPPAPGSFDMRARQRIKQWMVSTGVTQTLLAERIGKNQAWISRYLAGEFDADLTTLQKFAEVFGHTLYALLDISPDVHETRLIEMYRALSPKARTLVVRMLEHLTQVRPARRTPR